jgi:CO/xanthine dehydrogenase Mo-binding subunit
MAKQTVLGGYLPRDDAEIKATGQAIYITDLKRPGMVFGKILFSDRPHARIINIDASEALALPGVEAVVTGDDAPDILYGLYMFDRYILAKRRVRHVGEPVAAVAAASLKIAEQAVRLIKVEYEDLPAVFDIDSALAADAPIVHSDVKEYAGLHPFINYGNTCMDARVEMGDVTFGFAQADHIIEGTFTTSPMHQAYLEPHGCVAEYDNNNRLTIWTATQQLSIVHSESAKSLGIPMNKIRVLPAWLGGGFGGKLKTLHEQICALLAMRARRPVKLVLTREEEFIASHPRANFRITMKTGFMKDGTLVAREVDILADMGAYTDHALGMVNHAITYSAGPYKVPNIRSRGRAVYTNNPDWGCMRGYGGNEITFAYESQMDEIAEILKMDPAELRYQNLVEEGDIYLTTQALRSVHIKETMDAAIEASGYNQKKGKMGPNRGIGIANSILNTGFLASSVFVRLNEDGSVNVLTSITDHGSGNLTALRQIAAEAMGVPLGEVSIAAQDTDSSPYDTGSIASRTIYDAGNAICLASEDLLKQVREIAADGFECAPEVIEVENGLVFDKNHPQSTRTLGSVSGEAIFTRSGPLMGRGACLANPPFRHSIGEGFGERPSGSFTFTTHVVEVEVDPETGNTVVLDYTACHDVGKVINRGGIEGQVEGGVIQGIGYALYEELITKNGVIQNPSFVDYHIPTALDSPPVKTLFIEEPEPLGPFGAKGVSEPPMIPPPAAIANAILDATGVQPNHIPFTPERLYGALKRRS